MSLPGYAPLPDGFALECQLCHWRPPADLTMGVVKAHFDTEHDGAKVHLEMVVLCPRCDRAMTHERTAGTKDYFACEPCHRTRVVTRKNRG